ncbi:MAG TPA: MarR family transcriptional regulator [Capillimicrobium sp.]|nr:MarR family transcriptional regulator [Capillimicrobium sp.]
MSDLVTAWRELSGRHAAVAEALERELQRRHGLSRSEFEVLDRLADAHRRHCRIQELADEVHLSQSALSRLVSRLEAEGLVERSACVVDRRGIYACLTPAGLQRVLEARPTQDEILERHLT